MTDGEKIVIGIGILWALTRKRERVDFQLPASLTAGSYNSMLTKLRKLAEARGVDAYNGARVPRLTNREAVAVIREWQSVAVDGWPDGKRLEQIATSADPTVLFPLDDTHALWLSLAKIAEATDAAHPTSDDAFGVYVMHFLADAALWPTWPPRS